MTRSFYRDKCDRQIYCFKMIFDVMRISQIFTRKFWQMISPMVTPQFSKSLWSVFCVDYVTALGRHRLRYFEKFRYLLFENYIKAGVTALRFIKICKIEEDRYNFNPRSILVRRFLTELQVVKLRGTLQKIFKLRLNDGAYSSYFSSSPLTLHSRFKFKT